jgi:hypothetical protein
MRQVLTAVLISVCTGVGHSAEPGDRPANRLAGETSPYLLMHAHNPVDWHPWGDEALAKARREDKLIFLSVGYSSCYWCHVMERESFMDDEVANYLNEHFICIKVDREERPDVDDVYMTALHVYFQLIGSPQGGGWPLSMFLTPEADPIFGGTYFPPRGKLGRTGFLDVLEFIQTAWTKRPEKLREDSQTLVRAVRATLAGADAAEEIPLNGMLAARAVTTLQSQFDPEYGGFGFSADNPRQPKFPEPANLMFLLEVARADGDDVDVAEKMLVATLDHMARGGIWDHLAGGFHRYSTDRYWHVPHFEKMLYDNGQLATVYSEAHALTGRDDFARIARQILDFTLREMTSDAGGFYSAIDAETDAEEGKFYVWTDDQLDVALTADERTLLDAVYGTGDEPVFESRHVLLMGEPLSVVAEQRGTTEAELLAELEPVRAKLLAVRNQRERPLTDTKILTAWNGLIIRGLADAGRILSEPRYTAAAARAAEFVLDELRTPDGRLLRSYAGDRAQHNAYLDDYAFLVDGLLALHAATDDRRWLVLADELTEKQIELFWEAGQGGFFFTSHDHQALFARGKKPTDGALPSGNSISAANLLTLSQTLEKPAYRDRARHTIAATLPLLRRAPAAAPRMTAALMRYVETQPDRVP